MNGMLSARAETNPRCTRCKRYRKGHLGPCGFRCSMKMPGDSDSDGSEGEFNQNQNGPVTRASTVPISRKQASNDTDHVISELARQVGELSLNMSVLLSERNAPSRAAVGQQCPAGSPDGDLVGAPARGRCTVFRHF